MCVCVWVPYSYTPKVHLPYPFDWSYSVITFWTLLILVERRFLMWTLRVWPSQRSTWHRGFFCIIQRLGILESCTKIHLYLVRSILMNPLLFQRDLSPLVVLIVVKFFFRCISVSVCPCCGTLLSPSLRSLRQRPVSCGSELLGIVLRSSPFLRERGCPTSSSHRDSCWTKVIRSGVLTPSYLKITKFGDANTMKETVGNLGLSPSWKKPSGSLD